MKYEYKEIKYSIVSTNCNQLSDFCNPELTTTFEWTIDDCSMGNLDKIQPDTSLPRKEWQKRLPQTKIQ